MVLSVGCSPPVFVFLKCVFYFLHGYATGDGIGFVTVAVIVIKRTPFLYKSVSSFGFGVESLWRLLTGK